ncbi:MAG: protein translocase subunit SecDF, partial [Bacteroidales bacterium]|nr:protein translocase subunit SecDF [Bacteroidales bacterium]
MQSKGAIKFVAILLLLASLWQLSFTLVANRQENKAEKYAEAKAEAAMNAAAFGKIAEADKAFYLDSIRKVENRRYIDSISSEKIYLGYTFKDIQGKAINLGLDLKGGMNVMLQVQLHDLVKALAGGSTAPEFTNALALAKERSVDSRNDFITLFAEAWEETSNGMPLAQIFGTYEMRDKIGPESTDAQVIEVIRAESESAISNSFNVLRNRIDRFGVTQPNIQKLGNSGRILVELPGVKEPERVRKLLQGTASLEFWPTYTNEEIEGYLAEANAFLAQMQAAEETVAEVAEETESDDILAEELKQAENDAAVEAEILKQNPLFALLQPSGARGHACIGYAHYSDTAQINKYLAMQQVKQFFPPEFKPMWTVKASAMDPNENIFELVAIKAPTRDGKAPLDGGAVTDARVQYGNSGGAPEVSMTMNAEGANVWARLTKDNIGRQIAIVLDGMVYSYPNVQSEISGGSSQITGNFTLEEAEDLANVLKSGKLPAPATIIQEQVVGPSLGAESINAGLISFVIAFILVLLYMLFFYRGAG